MEDKLFTAVRQVLVQVGKVILGKEEETREIMAAFLAEGHVLLEDIPGVGKTTLAVAFSRAMQLEYRRVQFTPDVLPSDLTGFSIYSREAEKFVYQPGSVFCNLLLADEINRMDFTEDTICAFGGYGREEGNGRRRNKKGTGTVSGHRYTESCRDRGNPAASRGTDRPVYDQHEHWISGL